MNVDVLKACKLVSGQGSDTNSKFPKFSRHALVDGYPAG